ncbi:hypothetical protein E0L01_05350 [Megamonas funiformis]|uniref:gp53-like domain-containing protein n=1 Tax=Megamonas funiformis TaxID=437897 RepID=UPI00142FC2D2|nr:hypothetical protein [Megamonas funiformis]NJE28192.1 hypothetical protein [Megamonas funiformis]
MDFSRSIKQWGYENANMSINFPISFSQKIFIIVDSIINDNVTEPRTNASLNLTLTSFYNKQVKQMAGESEIAKGTHFVYLVLGI